MLLVFFLILTTAQAVNITQLQYEYIEHYGINNFFNYNYNLNLLPFNFVTNNENFKSINLNLTVPNQDYPFFFTDEVTHNNSFMLKTPFNTCFGSGSSGNCDSNCNCQFSCGFYYFEAKIYTPYKNTYVAFQIKNGDGLINKHYPLTKGTDFYSFNIKISGIGIDPNFQEVGNTFPLLNVRTNTDNVQIMIYKFMIGYSYSSQWFSNLPSCINRGYSGNCN